VIDDSTKITKGKDAASLADLKAGLNVAIEAKKEGDKLTAATINVVAPETAPVKK
jgi:Cu/Ag efflux protein CusF